MQRWILIFVLLVPSAATAIDYNTGDVQTAIQRHDLRMLESLATSGEKPLRLEALEGLVRVNDPQVVPFLSSQMEDPDPDIAQAALWSLPNYGAQAALPDVIVHVEEMQHHQSVDVRKTAGTVLEDLRDPDKLQQMRSALVTKDSEQHKEALEFYTQRKDLSILLAARDMLQDNDPFIKQTGILLVHGLEDHDRLDAIIKLLQDPAPTVRAPAALVVGEWKEAAAFPLLDPLLKDPDPLVRASVVTALGKNQDIGISAALAGLSTDHITIVRVALAKALPKFATPASTDALLDMALDDNPLVRGPAIEGLVSFRNVIVTGKMSRFLTDKNSRKRRRAAVAYLSNPSLITPPAAFLPLLHDSNGEVRLDAVQALLGMPGAGAKAQLVYLLDDPQKDIRLAILRKLDSLLKIPNINKRVIKRSLAPMAKDKDLEMQTLAKKFLIQMETSAVIPGKTGLQKLPGL